MNELQRLRHVFQSAYRSRHSSFYRDFYLKKRFIVSPEFPATQEEWKTLPFLTTADLIRTSFFDRLFIPREQLEDVRTTSGTSGRGVLFFPRSRAHYPEELRKLHWSLKHMTRILLLHNALVARARQLWPEVAFINGDVRNLPATAHLAELFDIDALYGSPAVIVALLPYLSQGRRARITCIELMTDRCSDAQYEYMKGACPAARIVGDYSMVQTASLLTMPCEDLIKRGPSFMHPLDGDWYQWEIIDPDTEQIVHDGEFVFSTLFENSALPLFRYRTEDHVRVAPPCICGRPVYEILGRMTMDRYTLPMGGQLLAVELERVMRKYWNEVGDDFALHVHVKRGERDVSTRIELVVSPREGFTDTAGLARYVESELRIAPTKVLNDIIDARLIPQLTCAILDRAQAAGKKTRLVIHES